ncbi:hypothetical protein [uncultured Maricaulis sp.]|uniref:hypothetical protein n=1 Tax=uncultured Maricaulis sp. TaxID=174710 RepID=UPI002618C4C8|nr:hypothetical protein [uncultured Maricaulis sp.]
MKGSKPTPEELEASVRRMKAAVPASLLRAVLFSLLLGGASYFNRLQKDADVEWWVIIALMMFIGGLVFVSGVFFAGAPSRRR